jgi:hypothetical protein
MSKFSTRTLASLLVIIALFFCARAMMIFWVLVSVPQNFVPPAKGPAGCTVCPPSVFFSGETEQILTILLSLIVVAMAWLLWQKSTSARGVG